MAWFKLAYCLALLACGLILVVVFVQRSGNPRPASEAGHPHDARPWRPVGAVICLLLAVMFVLGVYLVDIPARPRVRSYAAFWMVIMVLVVWLCALAGKDVAFTLRRWNRRPRRAPTDDRFLSRG